MPRFTPWIALCLSIALLVGCSGVRTGGAGAPSCEPPCATVDAPEPAGDRPPEAKAGEAWCRVWQPPVSKEVEKRVLARPAGTRTIKIPAEYGTRPKLVCIAPAKLNEVTKPGVWTTKKEDVLVRPARSTYKRVKCSDDPCKECWVKQDCPPVWREDCKAVCLQPPTKRVEYTPAKYKMLEERFLIHPATCRKECVPAEYKMVRETVCVQPGRWVWRRNDTCEVPVETLPALEVEMVDSDPDGSPAGVFEIGQVVRYDLTVRSDVGSEAFPTIRVKFQLPEQLEFISGQGAGLSIEGAGREATSTVFKLSLDQEVKMYILAKVISVPPTAFVQAVASVQTEAGEELARDSESTTLAGKGEK